MKKKLISFFVIFFLLFLLGLYLLSKNYHDKYSKYIKDNTPFYFKEFLKDTIFFIPIQIRGYKKIKKEYDLILKENFFLSTDNNILQNKINYGTFEKEKIQNKYNLKKIILPFYDENNIYKNKKTGYIEIFKNKVIVVFGKGKILLFDKDSFEKEKFNNLKEIRSNLEKINYFDEKIDWTGIKDLKIIDDYVYLSITREVKKDCYSPAILFAKINLDYLDFDFIFKNEECVSTDKSIKAFKYFNGYQTGGRMVDYDNKIYLTIGDYNSWELPQNNNSIFGKIIEIDRDFNKYRIISKGHRNHQGLTVGSYSKYLLISSEHGPKGGDEINIINIKENFLSNNFGWPISSYGSHYDVVPLNSYTNKVAPLYKSHKKYDFKEPILYFNEFIAPSEIIKNYFSSRNQFLLTSLKSKSIFILEFNDTFTESKVVDKIFIGERIRDIVFDDQKNVYYLYLDDTPYIAELSIK